MTHRALITLPAATGLSEDACTNTLYFQVDPGGVPAALSALDAAIIAFYNTTGTGGMSTFLSAYLSRVANACSIRWYDLADPEPRVPVRTTNFTLGGAPGANDALPSEVSIVLSFQAPKVSGLNQARRRGRIYLGPLIGSTSVTITAGVSRPSATLISRITACAEALEDAANAVNSPWSVWSQTNLSPAGITDGWVDNAFDTQRRRGVRATARTAWS